MAKAKKVTAASIENIMTEGKDDVVELVLGSGEEQVSVEVKTRLSLTDRSQMVKDIVSMVFLQDDKGNEVYAPYLKEFAVPYCAVRYFTNITLPSSSNKVWEFIDRTKILSKINMAARAGYIDAIVRDADALIDYKKAEILKKSKFDAVLDTIAELLSDVKEKVNSLDIDALIDQLGIELPAGFGDEISNYFNIANNNSMSEK